MKNDLMYQLYQKIFTLPDSISYFIPMKQYTLRVGGKEYGPFSEDQIRNWIKDRPIGDDDAVWDGEAWTPLAAWLPKAEEAQSDVLEQMLSAPKTYMRITIAGVILLVFWATLFLGFRLYTGKWPIHKETRKHRPPVTDTIPAP